MDRFIDQWMFPLFFGLMGVILIGCLVAACAEAKSHEGEKCVESHITTTFVKSGSVLIPIESTTCDKWVAA